MTTRSVRNLGPRVSMKFASKGRTRQSETASCDINKIMAKYVKTGQVDHVAKHGGSYGFATSVSFHEAMNVVTKAESMFLDLPAATRKRFGNDPADFLDFVQNPANSEALADMGLAEATIVPEVGVTPPVVPVVPPAAPVEPEALPTG